MLPKTLVRNLLPDHGAANGFFQEKVSAKLDLMKFEDACVSTEHHYSLGVETDSGRRYLAIPVSNRMVDYLEYYALTDAEYRTFHDDGSRALAFAESCRRREHDDRLIMQPGTDRGVPR